MEKKKKTSNLESGMLPLHNFKPNLYLLTLGDMYVE